MVSRSWNRVGRCPKAGCDLFAGRRVLGPTLARSRKLVLQLQDGHDRFERLCRHPRHRHLVPRLIESRLSRRHARAGDADQKGQVL